MAQIEATAHDSDENIYRRIGQLTRTLHDALRELGYERELMDARDNLPGARDRLAYIARVTGEAAEKVLNAVDRARTVQQELTEQADSLRNRWQAVAAYAAGGRACTPAGKQLVDETCEFFSGVGGQADRTNTILTDIMMAQDFHDLTGQVIRRVVALATSLEEQLVKLLIETSRPEQRPQLDPYKLEGPLVAPNARDCVVAGVRRHPRALELVRIQLGSLFRTRGLDQQLHQLLLQRRRQRDDPANHLAREVVEVLRHHDVGQYRVGSVCLAADPGEELAGLVHQLLAGRSARSPAGRVGGDGLPAVAQAVGLLGQFLLNRARAIDRIEHLLGGLASDAGDVGQPVARTRQIVARVHQLALVAELAQRVVQRARQLSDPPVNVLVGIVCRCLDLSHGDGLIPAWS